MLKTRKIQEETRYKSQETNKFQNTNFKKWLLVFRI